MTELEQAKQIAEKVLDRAHADPDDDLAVLARQLLRLQEELTDYSRWGTFVPGADAREEGCACGEIVLYHKGQLCKHCQRLLS